MYREIRLPSPICANIVVDDPAFWVVFLAFIVRLVRFLVERVFDAFVEYLFGVIWP
jgi:hypothetical protein